MPFYSFCSNYFKENTYEKKRKWLVVLDLAVTSFVTLSGVVAAAQYPGGGIWTYGASNGGDFSNYYHGSKYHSSTVVSRWTSKSSKAYAYAGQTSYAFIKTSFGEQAAFYYN
ncbi:MAG: lactococcin 972 family bacteriocin [Streptococcus sp.]|nr:lactococcin 972 family bacteriocin [Streptococcus sp.]